MTFQEHKTRQIFLSLVNSFEHKIKHLKDHITSNIVTTSPFKTPQRKNIRWENL